MRCRAGRFVAMALGVWWLIACDRTTPTPPQAATTTKTESVKPEQSASPSPSAPAQPTVNPLMANARGLYGALPADAAQSHDVSDARTQLGRMLFFEKRLSLASDISCNSCHGLTTFGVDHQPTSLGHKAQRGERNAPTVYNAALHVAQFWDGRAADVEEQAKGPMLNPVEMAMPDAAAVENRLRQIPEYVAAFKLAFPKDAEPVSFNNTAIAIAAFERKLLTPGRFDEFVGGNAEALTPAEQHGLEIFTASGCGGCHNSALFGGQSYQKLGLVKPYLVTDVGRFAVTNKELDRFVFKVPSLRNVAQTAPYFHHGAVKTLAEAVRLMATHQLGRELSDADVAAIVSFLESLTGKIDSAYIAAPQLPDTPARPAPAKP